MMNPEATRHFHAMLDQHNAAVAALRRAKESRDESAAALRASAAASDEAFAAAIAANRSAVELLYALNTDTDPK